MYLYRMVYLLEACLRLGDYANRDIQICKNIYALAIVQNYVNARLRQAGVFGPVTLARGLKEVLEYAKPGVWEECFSDELTEILLAIEDEAASKRDVSDADCWELVHAMKQIPSANKPYAENAIYYVMNNKSGCFVDVEKGVKKDG